MSERKILKAYCDKTGKNYALYIDKKGSEWKVVDFVDISANEARVLTSEVSQPRFVTNSNLLACSSCGSRTVSGCNCASGNTRCRRGMSYNYQCIYCKHMVIDYSAATETQGLKDGDIITLSQGQVVKIKLPNGRNLEKMFVALGWDPVNSSTNLDLDSSVVIVDDRGRHETVYFGNLENSNKSVIHHGDNLTGNDGDTDGDDDENITVKLNSIPRNQTKLYFVLNVYSCDSRNQSLKDARNLYIRISDPVTKKQLMEYKITGNTRNGTALILGKAFRDGDGWSFKAIGAVSNATDIDELAEESKRY